MTVLAAAQAPIVVAAFLLLLGTLVLAVTRRFGYALAAYTVYIGALDGPLKLLSGSEGVALGRTALLGVIAGAGLLALLADRRQVTLPRGGLVLLALALIALVQIANPGNPNLIKPIGSLRQEIEFLPVFVLAFATVRREADLQTFLLLLVALAVANGIANLIQFNLTPQQFASWGPGYSDRIFGTNGDSGRIFVDGSGTDQSRPFGLGTDAGSGGIVGMFGAVAIVALMLQPRAAGFGSATLVRGLAVAAVPAVVLAVVLAQTRAILIATVFALLVVALLTARKQFVPLILVAGLTVVVGSVVISSVAGGDQGSALSRYADITPDQLVGTARSERGSSLALAPTYAGRFPFGAGLGGVGPSTGFKGAVRPEEKLNGETQFNVLLLDLGVPGALLVLGFAVWILSHLRRLKTVEDPATRAQLAALLSMFAGVCLLFFSGAPLTGAPAGPLFWGIGGIVAYWLAVPAAASVRSAAYRERWAPRARSQVSGATASRAASPIA